MVVMLSFQHIFKFPLEIVLKSYKDKHKYEKDSDVLKVEDISYTEEGEMECAKRNIYLYNYFPFFFRRLECLKIESIAVEEEIWSQTNEKRHWIRNRNVTWPEVTIANVVYLSQHSDNSKWTVWEHESVADLGGFGKFGVILELYLKRFLQNKINREIKSMERFMTSK